MTPGEEGVVVSKISHIGMCHPKGMVFGLLV